MYGRDYWTLGVIIGNMIILMYKVNIVLKTVKKKTNHENKRIIITIARRVSIRVDGLPISERL